MGRKSYTEYSRAWSAPDYVVDENGKVVGGYAPAEPNNWGRWGADDQRGTANYITPEAVLAAATGVRSGKVISLALPIDKDGPAYPGRSVPKHYFSMTGDDLVAGIPYLSAPEFTWTDDNIDMCTQASTQWDGLAHVAMHDVLYNGNWVGGVTAYAGASELGIHHQKTSFVGRGVLLDVARFHGLDSLDPGFQIDAAMLDAVAQRQGVSIRPGDMVIVRTGYLTRWWTATDIAARQRWLLGGEPGLGPDTIVWLHEHQIAAVAADTIGLEVMPAADPTLPVHRHGIVDLGLTLGELWHLEELATECEAAGQFEFLLIAAPLTIVGGVGSMLNPIAIL